MTDSDTDDLWLESLFDDAKRDAERPIDADLKARLIQDARDLQDAPKVGVNTQARPKSRFWRILDDIGGWPAVAGLSTAAVAGVWIGVAQPESLTTPFDVIAGDTTLSYDDYFPDYSGLLEDI